jgi:hypothetical protein
MNLPPVIEKSSSQQLKWTPLQCFIGLVALILATHFAVKWHLPLPICTLRHFTGIPCPACGSTRSLAACSHGDFSAAFFYNPLLFLLCIGVCIWVCVWCLERIMGKYWTVNLFQRFSAKLFKKWIIGLIILNWIYLYFYLPP